MDMDTEKDTQRQGETAIVMPQKYWDELMRLRDLPPDDPEYDAELVKMINLFFP